MPVSTIVDIKLMFRTYLFCFVCVVIGIAFDGHNAICEDTGKKPLTTLVKQRGKVKALEEKILRKCLFKTISLLY